MTTMSDDSSLIEKLRKAEALLSEAEKEMLVAQLDRVLVHGTERPTQGAVVESEGFGSILSYNENLKLQRNLMARRRNATTSASSSAAVRSEEEMRDIRSIQRRAAGSEWDNINFSLDEPDNANVTHKNHHEGATPFYRPPLQRHRWHEEISLPHINWGDLFFDLFYVGAAYNLGLLLTSAFLMKEGEVPDLLRGFIYFFGSLGPLWTCWEVQTFYESRYVTSDYFHRLVCIFRYVAVGIAISNITPIQVYGQPGSEDVMEFTLAILVEQMVSIVLGIELYFRALGDRISIQNHTLDNFRFLHGITFVLYLAAFILATVQHVRFQGVKGSEERSNWDIYDLPMTLTAASYFLRFFLSGLRLLWRDTNGDVRNWYVPTNIDYLIHRYGEFVMLMIGEGVLSLLIVQTTDDYTAVIFGMLTMIFIHVLKSESEPTDSSKHALWRNRLSVGLYNLSVHTLTIGLIGFGVCYKSFLHMILDLHKDESKKVEIDWEFSNMGYLFSGFLTVVVLSLEFMNMTHGGFKKAIGHLFRSSDGGKRKIRWPVVVVCLLKLGTILFCATLYDSLLRNVDPDKLSIAGFGIVLALSITRVLNHIFIDKAEWIEGATQRAVSITTGLRRQLTLQNEEADEGEGK